MLRALIESEATPDFVVGASAGAINAAYYAGRPNREGVEQLAAIWRGLHTADVFPLSPLHGLFGFIGWRSSLLDPAALRALLARELPYERLEDARVPLRIVATNVLDGSEVALSSGPTVDALLASTAIPSVFPPVALDGTLLFDGGISSNTPLTTAVKLGAKRVVVLPTGYSCALAKPPNGAVAMVLHALTLLMARQLVIDVERWRQKAEIVIVPPLCPIETSAYDFSASEELIRRAAASTRTWLATGGLARTDVPHELVPHDHLTV